LSHKAVKVENQRQRVKWYQSHRDIEREELHRTFQRIAAINHKLGTEQRKLSCMLQNGVKP
jgi:hypothetical protein